jgi:hypothetical protein
MQRFEDGEEAGAHSAMDAETGASHTLRWEGLRAFLERPAHIAIQGSGIALVIAIQHFDASPNAKALIAGAGHIGLMASPLMVALASRLGLSAGHALALTMFLAATGLGLASAGEGFGLFFAGVMIGGPLLTASAPLVTALWEDGVPARRRGTHYARIASMAGLIGVLSSMAMAAWLEGGMHRYRPLLSLLALALAGGAWAGSRIRGAPVRSQAGNPYRNLGLIRTEPEFGLILLGWFLLGFGNLATLPLRVEFLATAEFGRDYGPQAMIWLTQVIPQGVALLATLYWGRFFDRFHYLTLRIVLNVFFALSILCFFTPWLWSQVTGALLLGVAQGGGHLIWGLWVTRFAGAGRTADYMGVHTFLTGLRGLLGPFLAYRMIATMSIIQVAWLGAGLVLLSNWIFLHLWRRSRAEAGAGSD